MGVFKIAQKGGNSMVMEDPHRKVCREMVHEGRIFAVYSRGGEFLADHFGKTGNINGLDYQAFYLALNLNFIQDFGNSVNVGIYNVQGAQLLSPGLSSYRLIYHQGDDVVIHTNKKDKGFSVGVNDYDNGVLLSLLKLPKEWSLPKDAQIRVKVQASLLFNPGEVETFLLKIRT